MRRDVYGHRHPNVANALSNLGRAQMSVGEPHTAEATLTEALSIFEGAFGPDHPRVATVLVGLARLDHDAGRHEAAVRQFRRAESIRIATLGEDHPQTAALRIDLGRDLMEVGDEVGAEAAFMASHRALSGRGEEEAGNMRLVLGYLIDLSVAEGDGAAAARYQQELLGLSG